MNSDSRYFFKVMFVFIFAIFLLSGCGKKVTEGKSLDTIGGVESPETTPVPRKLKNIKLGQADNFSILAYAGINSVSNSKISGKVGLMPAMRDQILILPREVEGGASDIIGPEDETSPMNLLSNAKVDMVTAYASAVELAGDRDKIDIYSGNIDNKILFPGVYQWKESMIILKNFMLFGSDSDVWIFKIHGHLKVMPDVRMIFGEGVNPKNIMWQIAGSVVLGERSHFAGTIIAQPSIEMKNNSVLTGRAFCKNGFVNLYQATIRMP